MQTRFLIFLFPGILSALDGGFADSPLPQITNFDDHWEFLRVESTPPRANAYDQANQNLAQEMAGLAGKTWEKVTLPHTAFIEPKEITDPWQGVCWHRKTFHLPVEDKGRRVTLEIGGAMQIADVWFNDKYVLRHLGGYMGFTIDLTDLANYGGENSIAIKLDNRPDPLVPPGKPLNGIDFCYYSGLYRDVYLRVSNPLHLTNSVEAEKVGGGGVFVTYASVSDKSALVNVKTQVKLEAMGKPSNGCELQQELFDLAGNLVAKASPASFDLQPGQDKEIEQSFQVINPRLWSPDHPNLYVLKTQIVQAGAVVDENTNRIGIRTFTVTRDEGLKINGQPVRLMGTNRHMEYPWIGNAVSTNAQYRDIWLIKNAGFNSVRLCHYPQDPSVYAACDELGVLAIDCTPGWQYYNKDQQFQDNVFRDIRQMIRRDRNHPSILFWEINLNESNSPFDFCKKSQAVAKEEFPEGLTSGDERGPATWDVTYPPFSKGAFYSPDPNAIYYGREYGDWEFGGNNSSSRKTRGDGEQALLQQTWNFAFRHNRNYSQIPPLCGDGTWVMFDYNRGYNKKTERSGMADITRLPKWVYYYYQSQRDPAGTSAAAGIEAGPMIIIANNWTQRPPAPGKVVVFSNCDEVELFANGKSVARQPPDNGPDGGKGMWSGGDCLHVAHPAFTFNTVSYEPGELKAVGYLKGQACARQSVFTPGNSAKLKLEAALNNRPLTADGADVIFVHARVLDGDGHLCSEAKNALKFSVTGPAHIISPDTVDAEAGIGSILLQATDQPGTIAVTASSSGLSEDSITVVSKAP